MTTTYSTGTRVDHYEIIRQLGHGGMNTVYLARDTLNGQEVVLKFPNDDLISNVGVYERYKREAEIGSRLDHPHIQRLLNTDEKRCEHYLVMEYIQGRTLREVLEAASPNLLPLDEVLRIITQICDALAYCHARGVFHRDIKPENIMLLEDGDVKIIDFGVALLEGARRVTWRGLSGTVGTPDYMAPEQLQGGRGYASSDIYAVGVMLYEMLCGRVPFEGENVFAVLNQHITQDPPSIRQFNPHISTALETVVMHAIRRDADKRYKSMADILHDLTHLHNIKPVPYKPAAPQMHTTKRQLILGLAIAGAIILAIIVIGVLAQVLHTVVR
ncbi:MAG TPA: serine/threonine-protein kinase [Ktedonobacteraceae bacterium]|nr:serine/threonine-protein kinase [Ktedonobacteraceae bacterium]